MAAKPSRTTGWSSARMTLIFCTGGILTAAFIDCLRFHRMGSRQVDDDPRAVAGTARDEELATNGARSIAHVVQAVSLPGVELGGQRHAATVVDHAQGPFRLFLEQHDSHGARMGMTPCVAHGFGSDAEE